MDTTRSDKQEMVAASRHHPTRHLIFVFHLFLICSLHKDDYVDSFPSSSSTAVDPKQPHGGRQRPQSWRLAVKSSQTAPARARMPRVSNSNRRSRIPNLQSAP